jgi:hypothetical protein
MRQADRYAYKDAKKGPPLDFDDAWDEPLGVSLKIESARNARAELSRIFAVSYRVQHNDPEC